MNQTSRIQRRQLLLSLESCEERALMTATLGKGVLNVVGTRLDDVIEVRLAPTNPKLIQVIENAKVTFTKPIAGVRQVRISAGQGDDSVTINQANGKIAIPTVLIGGQGNDSFQGGSGTNQIDGGQGINAYKTSTGHDKVINAARADKVVKLGSTSAFRDFLTHSSKGRSRFGGILNPIPDVTGIAAPAATPTSGSTSNKIAAPGFSQTNTQVAGIDEADIIENDGQYLYILSRNELLIVDAQNADQPAVVSRTTIDGSPVAEYLNNGHLTVVSTVWNSVSTPAGSEGMMPLLRIRGSSQVEVTVYDVNDKTAPKVLSQTKLDGWYSDSRMVDGKLALIVQNDLLSGYWGNIYGPMVRFAPGSVGSVTVTNASLEKMIQKTPIEKLLPTWSSTNTNSAGSKVTNSGLINQPQDLYCPVLGNEANLMSLVLLDTTTASPAIVGSASVIGGYASTIFMNSKDLYIFSPKWDSTSGDTTNVQRFDISTNTPTLVSTGSFQGQLLNQFSADAQGNFLRVATTSWTDTGRTNAVYVLTTEGDTIKTIGAVTGIAPGESITSARFLGDTAYLVTFLQTDPLYTIDLSTPTAPKIVGELKLPGFSRFLQPLGEGYLVGIGRDADPANGRTLGLKVSLFDVRNAAAPAEVASYKIQQPSDGWSWSNAEWDHHALGFFPELGVIAVPVQGYVQGTPDPNDPNGYVPYVQKSDLVLLKVDPASGISQLGSIDQNSTLLRSARIGDVIYSVADLDMKAVEVLTDGITPRGSVDLQKPYDTSGGGVIYY